jgi:hypothetical protein
LVTVTIIGSTVLSFQLISAAPSGAVGGQLSGWLAMDGNIRYVSNGTNLFGFGNEGPAAGTTCTNAGAVDVAGTHGLFNCGSPGPAGDNPNAALTANGDGSIISRDFIPDPSGSQNQQGCTNGDSTSFAGGQKFGGSATYTTPGPVNGKDDLSNAYFVARAQQAGDPSPGDKELFFGLERAGSGGDDAVDIEFLQQGAAMAGCTGPLTENRSQGDFGIEFDWVNGGGTPAPQLFVWECTGTTSGNPATGTACNPGVAPFANAGYVSVPFPTGSIQLAENGGVAAPGTLCGGWVCASGANVPATEFVEGGIDLAGVGLSATCASSVVAATHSSQAFDSDLKDFVGPGPFSLCPSTTTTTPVNTTGGPNIGGTWDDTATVSGAFGTPTGTMTFFSCSPSQLTTASATTCSNTIGTQIAGTVSNPNPAILDGSGDATSPPITPNEVGTWCFAGYYSGVAGKYAPSADASSSECFQVGPAPSTTTTQQSASLSGTGTAVIGTSGATITDTATVAGNAVGGAPTGTVNFYVCGPSLSGNVNCSNSGTPVGGSTGLAAVTSTNNSAATSASFTPTALGTYCFAAYYTPASGALYAASNDNTTGTPDANECFNITASPSNTTTQQSTTTSGSGSVTIGASGVVTDSVTVTGVAGAGFPSGHVQFYLCGPFNPTGNQLCTSTSTPEGDPVTGGSGIVGTATSNGFTPTAVGTYCYAAVYTPDGSSDYLGSADNNSGNVANSECFTVNPAVPTTTTQQSTTTSGSGSIVIGPSGTVTDTVTVAGNADGGAPIGTVNFFVCGPTGANALCSSTSNPVGSPTLTTGVPTTDDSQATSDGFTPTVVGTYCFGAVYVPTTGPPPSNYSASSDNTSGTVQPTECFTVNKAPTHTTTQQSGSSSGPGTVQLGNGSITDTAVVTGNATAGTPTGDVSFFECGPTASPALCTGGTQVGSPVPLGAPTTSSSASATSSAFTPMSGVGFYCFAAIFTPSGANANYNGSTDNRDAETDIQSNECFNATPAASTTTTQQSGATSGEGGIVLGAGGITDTAVVAGIPAGGAPQGSVDFFVCGPSSSGPITCTNTGTAEGTPSLTTGSPSTNDSTATSNSFVPHATGTYCFAAYYVPPTSGSNYLASNDNTSGTADQNECFTAAAAPSVTTTQQSATTSGAGSIVIGPSGTVTDKVTVSGNQTAGAPSGSVDFFVCGPSSSGNITCTNAGTAEGTPTLTTGTPTADQSQATSSGVTPTVVGTYCFAAYYVPDGASNYSASNDNTSGTADANECFTVNPATPTVTTQQSGSTSDEGTIVIGAGSITDTAVVTGNDTAGTPTGTVTFFTCGPLSSTALCTSGTQLGTPVALGAPTTSDSASATSTGIEPGQVGTYCFAAVFTPGPPNANYLTASDNRAGDIQSNECFTVTPAPSVTTTQQSTTGGQINIGGSITDTATVTGNSTGGAPTGSVKFLECGPTTTAAPCTDGTQVGSDAVTLGNFTSTTSSATSAAFTPTATGTYCFAAEYTPDGSSNYLASTDNEGIDVAANECFLVTTPDFTVTKTDNVGDGNPTTPGSSIDYTVAIANIGNGSGSAVVTDAVPSYLAVTAGPTCGSLTGSDTCSVTNPSGSTYLFSVTLAAGDTVSVTFTATVSATQTTDVVNTATVTTGPCDNGTATATSDKANAKSNAAVNNCSSTVTNPVIVLSVVKSSTPASGSTVALGASVTYSLVLTDSGTAPATGITMTDAVPTGTTYVASSATCGGVSGCLVTESNGTVTWTGLAVNPGASNAVTVSFKVTVNNNDTNNETIPNFAIFTNEGTPSCTTATCHTNTVTLTVNIPATLPATTTTTTTTTAPPVTKPATIAFTGADIAGMAAGGLVLIGLGGFLLLLTRRRKQAGETG